MAQALRVESSVIDALREDVRRAVNVAMSERNRRRRCAERQWRMEEGSTQDDPIVLGEGSTQDDAIVLDEEPELHDWLFDLNE